MLRNTDLGLPSRLGAPPRFGFAGIGPIILPWSGYRSAAILSDELTRSGLAMDNSRRQGSRGIDQFPSPGRGNTQSLGGVVSGREASPDFDRCHRGIITGL